MTGGGGTLQKGHEKGGGGRLVKGKKTKRFPYCVGKGEKIIEEDRFRRRERKSYNNEGREQGQSKKTAIGKSSKKTKYL